VPRRLLALVAAVAMVAGAFAVRGWLDRRSEDKANPPVLVCVQELADFCRLIATRTDVNVKVEAPGDTAERTAALNGAGDFNGWLTLSHWPAIAQGRRVTKGLPQIFTSIDNPVLARSPIVMAIWPDRAAAVRRNCPSQQIDWKCLGEVAGKGQWSAVPGGDPTWGPVKIAMGDPQNGAVANAALGAAAADFFEQRPDLSMAEFEDDAFRDWVSGLKRRTPSGRQPGIAEVLATGKSLEDVYAGLEAEVVPALNAYARPDKPVLIYPSPVATADLVLAVVPGRAGERLRDIVGDMAEELVDLGWKPGAGPALPADDGLPEPGVLDALRQVWKEAA
jgi:Bacterial extracellular solute-binding protein